MDLPWTKIGRAAVCFLYKFLGALLTISRFDLRDHVHRLGKQPSDQEKIDLSKQRRRLQQRLETYCRGAAEHIGDDIMALVEESQNSNVDESNALDEEEGPPSPQSTQEPEHWILPLPSSIPPLVLLQQHRHISGLLDHEYQLREGLANDALEQVREVLIQMAWQIRFDVHPTSGNRQTTRARNGVHLLQQDLWKYRRIYNHNRSRMIAVKGFVSADTSERYPALTKEDCKTSAITADPNAPGQSSHALPWFWTQIGSGDNKGEYMAECNVISVCAFPSKLDRIFEVYRLHWLRTRARMHRWREELLLTKYEMQWTVRFFMHMARLWQTRRDLPSSTPNKRAYAEERISMWNDMGRTTDAAFFKVNPSHTRIWTAVPHSR